MALGFADALSRLDPRVVEPFLAASGTRVAERRSAKKIAVELAGTMRGTGSFPDAARVELLGRPRGAVLARFEGAPGSERRIDRSECLLAADDEGVWSVEAWRSPSPFQRPHGARRPFVAMHTGTDPISGGAGARPLDLGFDGIAWGSDRVSEVRAAAEVLGGDLERLPRARHRGPEGHGDRLLRAAMGAMAGGPGWSACPPIELPQGPEWPDERGARRRPGPPRGPRARGGDGRGARALPARGLRMETDGAALSLAEELDSPLVGVCFNLCHFLKVQDASDPAATLRAAGARLFAVTVNGADLDGENWATLIQPLGAGDHDLEGLLRLLDEVGFEGPVGLQAYGIALPAPVHLRASMGAWRAAHGR